MPTGLRVPVGVNKSGGANIESDESQQLKKMLFLALSEGDDDNAFQGLGIAKILIFSIRNAAFRGRAERSINAILAKFADRVALRPDMPLLFEENAPGEVTLTFEYIDKLTDKVEEFRSTFTNKG